MTTYTSMGDGVQMATAIGAGTTRMEEAANLMSQFAPTVVWGYYNSIIHVSPDGKRLGNENNIHSAADNAKAAGFLSWWTIADETLVKGVHAETFRTREKAGGVIKADTLEELAEKTHIPFQQLKATVDKYNADAQAGTDTEFKKTTAFMPISAPYYAIPSTIVRYKTNGGLDINVNCEVVDRGKNVIANLYAAGSCQGQTTPNVNDVCALGMHAGQKMVAALKKA
jgi:succinate dehydrogenase/fumarate reductase flavoprotein subunit